MTNAWRTFASKIRRAWRIVVLFCALRFVAGVAAIALFDRGAIAWGTELTVVVAAMVVIYLLVALAVRWWSPPRRA